MTITANPTANGRMPRKNLSSQLDRLDSILDGLDQALAGAITDAVKEAVATSVADAVRVTLVEIVTNPDVIALLRGNFPAAPPATAEPNPKAANRVTLVDRIRKSVSAAWKWSLSKVKAVGQAIKSRARNVRTGIVGGVRKVNMVWRLKRPLLIALGVGSIMGSVAYASSPWVAAVLSGIAATGATLGAQLALWTRRLFAGFSMR